MKKAIADPEQIKRAKEIGLEMKWMSGEEYGKFLQEQDEWVRPLVTLYRNERRHRGGSVDSVSRGTTESVLTN